MQSYTIPPTWPNFFSTTPSIRPSPPSRTGPKTLRKRFKTAPIPQKCQLPDNHLLTPYQLPTNSYRGRSW